MEFRLSTSSDAELVAVPYRLSLTSSRVSIEKEESNKFLRRLRDMGFTTLYGELLRTVEEQMSLIPFRPVIQNTGCEIARSSSQPEWLLMWEVHKPDIWSEYQEIGLERGPKLNVVHLMQDGTNPALDRASIAGLFGVKTTDCNEGLWEQVWNVENLSVRQYLQNQRGKSMNEVQGRRELREQLEKRAMQVDSANGLELELSVAEALHEAGWWFRSGIETPFGELDHVVAILDSLVLVECKNTKSIGMRDIQVLVARAASIGAEYAFLITTMSSESLHSNIREALKQLRRSGTVFVMVLFVRDLGEHVNYWVSEIGSMIGYAMIDHWMMADESFYRRSPLWKMDGDGRINGFDSIALSEFIDIDLSAEE